MDSDRFDRWTKLFALRMSRRTAATGLGAAAVASLAAPRWTLGQDDDEDQNTDDQNTDDQNDDDGGDDVSDDDLGLNPCLPIVSCKRQHCNANVNPDGSGECHYDEIGPIPGGPYEQELTWAIPPCQPKNTNFRELEAKCNAAYPGDNCAHCCNNECQACSDFSLFNCH